ncbi:MAG: YfbR-like 5'-deoxynucleotidase [Candidatus Nitrosocaldus sp.]
MMNINHKIDSTILDHGGLYNDGDGLTIGCFYALDSIRHFGRIHSGVNISIAMHSIQAAMIGAKWYNWQATRGFKWSLSQCEFVVLCTMHDLSEAIVGDVWRPAKTEESEEQEKLVHSRIMQFLELNINSDQMVTAELKKVDNAAQFCELVHYLEMSPNHPGLSSIGVSQARIIIQSEMDGFCMKALGLEKHPVAVRLISETNAIMKRAFAP